MKDPFEFEAKYYDIVWGSACDYLRETELLDRIFKTNNVNKVLDVACGTGGHAIELAKLDYSVVGFDISNKMLEIATEKAERAGVRIRFISGDMTELLQTLKKEDVALPFDAVICLGYSMAHMTTDKDLTRALEGFREVLREGGLCIFSVRNAKMLRDSMINRLLVDKLVHEPNFSLALLGYAYRDRVNPDALVWNAIYLINDHGKVDFQVRTRYQRRFRFQELKKLLESKRFTVINVYGDTYGLDDFNEDKHRTMLFICRAGSVH